MSADLSSLTFSSPLLGELIFMSSSFTILFIDWSPGYFERSLLSLLQNYLPQWRHRNFMQDAYLCLLGISPAIMITNSLKDFPASTENFRIAVVSLLVLLSFWMQSKKRLSNVSNQSVGTPQIQMSHRSVGVSTCCGARVPRRLLSLSLLASSSSSFSSLEPQPEVNIDEEMSADYVKAFRENFDEDDVPVEKLVTAIKYLNTLEGGIKAHRDSKKLVSALDHLESMRSRMDNSGFLQEYSYEELHHILVERSGYKLGDFERVLEMNLETSGFLPSPEEFVDLYEETKGIVQLEKEVEETRQEMAETRQEVVRTRRVVEETKQEVVQSRQKVLSLRQRLRQKNQAIQQKDQALQQKDQALQQKDQALQQKDQALQQKDETIQQKDRLLQQKNQQLQQLRQRVEQNSEGESQRLKEENRQLSTQSQRALCKICWVEEVQVAFLPCGHLVSCEGCVDNLPQGKCPVCRVKILNKVKILLS